VVAFCDSTWSLTSARVACTGGAEKFVSPARKTFFDSIGQTETIQQIRGRGSFLQQETSPLPDRQLARGHKTLV
jgi:hypothetical protein